MYNELEIMQPKILDNTRLSIEKELNNFFDLADYRGETPRTYKKGIYCFINYLKDHNITTVSTEEVQKYKKYLCSKYKPRTINTYLSGLRVLFNYLSDLGITNITNNIKSVKIQKGYAKLPIPFEKFIEIKTTLKQERKDEATYRDYAMFILACYCMLREIEISRSDKNDIVQIGNQYVLMIQGKGYDSKDDMAILEEDILQPILDYLEVRGKDEYDPLFTSVATNHKGNRLTTRSISRIFKNILVRFGLNSSLYTGHSTRHTGGTFLEDTEQKLEDIQDVMRHKDINTTRIYAHKKNRLYNSMEKVIQNYVREGEKLYGIA